MQELAPAYLSAIAAQIGGLSAFLGGFSATFLGTLLALGGRARSTTVAIGFAAVSSVAFIVAVIASTMLVALLHPQAPPAAGAVSPLGARALLSLAFMLGAYGLLVSLALSGWARSKATGRTTTAAAVVGMMLTTWLIVSVG